MQSNWFERLGGTPALAQFLSAEEIPLPAVARVVADTREHYQLVDSAGREWPAVPAGRLRKGTLPVTGDWVRFESSEGLARILEVLPRHGVLQRSAVGTSGAAQVLAANLDTVYICLALDRDVRESVALRFVTAVRACGIEAAILLTKADLHPDPAEVVAALSAALPDVSIRAVSAMGGRGIEKLRAEVTNGCTVAFVGPSGAGKSSLVNAWIGEVQQEVGEVRAGDAKGRHTTTARQLHILPHSGLLLDTPGVREFGLSSDTEAVAGSFSDIEDLSAECRFRDCAHEGEPGCAVRRAVDEGTLAAERYEAWQKLMRESAFREKQQSMTAAAIEKARWKSVHKRKRDLDE